MTNDHDKTEGVIASSSATLLGRNARILGGIVEQNQPAYYEGLSGFWCQGDCVFIQGATSPEQATVAYRQRMTENRIGINHNNFCGSIISLKRREWSDALKADPSLGQSAKHALEHDAP